MTALDFLDFDEDDLRPPTFQNPRSRVQSESSGRSTDESPINQSLIMPSRLFFDVVSQALSLVHLRPLLNDNAVIALLQTERTIYRSFVDRPIALKHICNQNDWVHAANHRCHHLLIEKVHVRTMFIASMFPRHVKYVILHVSSMTVYDLSLLPSRVTSLVITGRSPNLVFPDYQTPLCSIEFSGYVC